MVGYQSIAISENSYSLFSPTFKGVSKTLDLTSIKLVDADGEEVDCSNLLTIQVMNPNGAYGDYYEYFTALGGWCVDNVPVEEGEVLINPGDSFCVINDYGSGIYFRVSGEVDLVCKNAISSNAYSLTGNSTPVSFDLTEIKLVDSDGEEIDCANMFTIQTMNDDGSYGDYYEYFTVLGGWCVDNVPVEEGEVTVRSGDAFCVINDIGEGCYLKLPSPLK